MSRFARALRMAVAALPVALAGLSAQQVTNLPARDVVLQPRPTDVFKVGKVEGAAWELYGARVEAAFDGAGNLYVFDPENFRVVVVSPTGAFLRQVGKRGDGPGELRSPATFTVSRDGTVVIADLGQRALLVYDAKGEYQRSVSLGSESLVILTSLAADPRGGGVFGSGRRLAINPGSLNVRSDGTLADPLPTAPRGRPIMRYGLEPGAEAREVHVAWEAPQPEAPGVSSNPGQGTFVISRPMRAFDPPLLTGALPDGGLVVSDSSGYALKILGADGAVRRILRRPITPQAVTPQVQRAEKERRLAALESGTGGQPGMRISLGAAAGAAGGGAPVELPQSAMQDMMRRNIEQLEFYPEIPVLASVATGWTGKIWVGRSARDNAERGPVDVLAQTGEYLGTLPPNGLRTPNAFGPEGLAAFVERDALGVVSVAVRRLPTDLR